MFWHNYKNAFRTLVKNKALVFWTLVFPFVLAILFNLAFARLHDYDVFEPLDIAVVESEQMDNSQVFKEALKSLGEGDNKIFNLEYTDLDTAKGRLNDEKITGYIYANDGPIKVQIKKNGVNETVLVTVVDQLLQSSQIVDEIATPQISEYAASGQPIDEATIAAIYQEAVKTVTEASPNVKDNSHVMDIVSTEFFTLIAMACMQGAMLSVELTNRSMPNITNRGKRVAVSPTRKSVVVTSNLLAGYTMLFVSVMALILFTRFILGVDYGPNLPLVCVVAAVGSLTATMMGVFLSIVLKTNENAKNIIVVIVTMVGCLFAGMFGVTKGFFDSAAPMVNKVSPVGLITDGFYSLLYYEDMTRFWVNIASLFVVTVVFFVLSIRGLRRQNYDSI
jgi:ABC-2 type transport system permease protein